MILKFALSDDGIHRNQFKEYFSATPELYNQKNFYEYYSSRLALMRALEEIHIPLQIEELNIENHHHLKKYPHILTSIAHTKIQDELYLSCALVAHETEAQSLGIDLELAQREIKPETIRHLDADQNFKGDLLSLWVKKEASYKALSSLNKDPKLKEIRIGDNEFSFNETQGQIEFLKDLISGHLVYVGKAII